MRNRSRQNNYMANSNMEINKLWLFESDNNKVNNMHQRGYVVSGDSNAVGNVEDIFHRYGVGEGNVLTEAIIAKELPNLIQVSPYTKGEVMIPNGWNHKRLNFVLEVRVSINTSKTEVYFLQGFTDYYDPLRDMSSGINVSDAIDPDMKFHINSMAALDVIRDPRGEYHTTVKEKVSIVKDMSGATVYETIEQDSLKLTRPSDIVEEILYRKTSTSGHLTYADLTEKPETTNKDNLGTTGFFADMMNKIIEGKNAAVEDRRTPDSTNINQLKNATLELSNYNLIKSPFFLELYNITHEARPSFFTIDILLKMEPYLDEKTMLFSSEDVENDELLRSKTMQGNFDANILHSNNLADTAQPTIENLKSYEFLTMLTSSMMENMITSTSVYLSNDPSKVTQPIAKVYNAMSAYHKDLATVTSFNIIESYMKLVILPKLVDVDLYIDLIANINILGNSSITISVNMHQPILTRYKSSADGLYSPHITGSNDKAALVNDVSTFIDMIK